MAGESGAIDKVRVAPTDAGGYIATQKGKPEMATMSKILSDRTPSPSLDDLEEQILELRREISALTKNLAAYGSAKVDDYRSDLEGFASDALGASANAFARARDEAISLEEGFEDQVRARPLQAVGIALGVGFLAALLTRR